MTKEEYKKRQSRLKHYGFKSYHDYLKSKHWLNLKRKLKKNDRFKFCYKCFSKENIELHHCSYKYIMRREERFKIIPLCSRCHRLLHELYPDHATHQATQLFMTKTKLNKYDSKI